MSLPIILAIVLTAAILAWVVVYVVVRHQREVAANKMFQTDPMDAEIGREALRRVFGILADEDPAPTVTPAAARHRSQRPRAPCRPRRRWPPARPTPSPLARLLLAPRAQRSARPIGAPPWRRRH